MSLLAQQRTQPLGQIGNDASGAMGPFSNIGANATETIKNVSTLLSNLVGFFTILAGLWFGFQLVLGAFGWITSGGDKHGLETARNGMVHALIGLIVTVFSLAIIGIIGKVFGLDILLTDPQAVCKQITNNSTACQ